MSSPVTYRGRRPILDSTKRKVVEGFRIPDDRPLTRNERGWVEMLRLLAGDQDPPVTLPAVEALRCALTNV